MPVVTDRRHPTDSDGCIRMVMKREEKPLAVELAADVADEVSQRGAELFKNGHVHIQSADGRWASGFVEDDDRVERTSLDRSRFRIQLGCSCTRWQQQICPHVWALVLFVDDLESRQKAAPDRDGSKDSGKEAGPSSTRRTVWDEDEFNLRDEFPGLDDFPDFLDFGEEYDDEDDEDIEDDEEPTIAPDNQSWQSRLVGLRYSLQDQVPGRRGGPPGVEERLEYVLDVARFTESGFVIQVYLRKRKKDGKWGTKRPAEPKPDLLRRLNSPEDERICSILRESDRPGWGWRSSEMHVSTALLESVFPDLVASGRLYVAAPDSEDDLSVESGGEEPWEVVARVREDGDDARSWVLRGFLRRGPEEIPLEEVYLLFPFGWFLAHGKASRYDFKGNMEWVFFLRNEKPLRASKREGQIFAERLWGLPELPTIEWPEELRFEEVTTPPNPQARIAPAANDPRRHPRLRVSLRYDYEDIIVESDRMGQQVPDLARRRVVRRDFDAEAAHRTTALTLGASVPASYLVRDEVFGETDLELPPNKLPGFVRQLLDRNWNVEAEGKVYRQASNVSISVTSGIDWFDVHAQVAFGGETIGLPALLSALRRGENSVVLGDGTHGMLPETWLEKNALVLSGGEVHDDSLRFRPTQVMLLDALLAAEGGATDETFEEARKRLHSIGKVEPREAPSGFEGTLRRYQKDGLGWFEFLEAAGLGGCLADDMGLGKTVQVLARLQARRRSVTEDAARKPSLVVVPRSLVFNWMEEARRFAPELRVLDHSGPDRRKEIEHFSEYDLVLTTYGVLVRDAAFLKDASFDYAILDEAQAIKNDKTTFAKAARLLKADHRLALSGTPIENHLGELWSLFEFLNPGMLGKSGVFKSVVGMGYDASGEAVQTFAKAVRPVILRRTKSEVAKDLPERVEQTLVCELDGEARRHYDELRQHYRNSLLGVDSLLSFKKNRLQVLEALLRLRQAACHVGMIDPRWKDVSSPKLELLLERLRELVREGHKALVFSQFTKFLALVRERLDAEGITYEYLDGRTRKRQDKVERFQADDDCKLFLISLKAGGYGLNLTAADYVFLLDPWWNPAAEAQAIDRTHRIGQTRTVVACRLIARDTVEEKVLKLQQRKQALADEILAGKGGLLKDMKPEDLELLLS